MTDVDAIGRRVDEAVGALAAALEAANREIERLEVAAVTDYPGDTTETETTAALTAVAEVSAARLARGAELSRAVIEQVRELRIASLGGCSRREAEAHVDGTWRGVTEPSRPAAIDNGVTAPVNARLARVEDLAWSIIAVLTSPAGTATEREARDKMHALALSHPIDRTPR